MRRGLATLLRLGADLFTDINLSGKNTATVQEILRQADILRDRLGATVAGLRSANTSVPYEIGAARERHIEAGDMILRAAITSAALFWNQLAMLHNAHDADFLVDPDLQEMRRRLAVHLHLMADAIVQSKVAPMTNAHMLVTPAVLANARYAEYATNTANRFEELQSFTATLPPAID
jgi:multidrug resistance protein MdtO